MIYLFGNELKGFASEARSRGLEISDVVSNVTNYAGLDGGPKLEVRQQMVGKEGRIFLNLVGRIIATADGSSQTPESLLEQLGYVPLTDELVGHPKITEAAMRVGFGSNDYTEALPHHHRGQVGFTLYSPPGWKSELYEFGHDHLGRFVEYDSSIEAFRIILDLVEGKRKLERENSLGFGVKAIELT